MMGDRRPQRPGKRCPGLEGILCGTPECHPPIEGKNPTGQGEARAPLLLQCRFSVADMEQWQRLGGGNGDQGKRPHRIYI